MTNTKINNLWSYHVINHMIGNVYENETDTTKIQILSKLSKSKRYILSNSVLGQIHKVKVTDKTDKIYNHNIIKLLPNVCETIILDDRDTIQYSFDGEQLFILYIKTDRINLGGTFEFNYDIHELTYKVGDTDILYRRDGSCKFTSEKYFQTDNEWMSYVYGRFLQIISFIHLTPITYKIIEPKSKIGDFIKGTQIKNETKNSITVINIDWNYHTIRMTGFDVRGHYRWQVCGVGLSEIKLIFISPFKKMGYKRKSQKELVG